MALINTTHGEIDDALLVKKAGEIDTENEITRWHEYWLNGELVHRSVHVELKLTAESQALLGGF
jgi:hypothetical protein